jgi:hypothetical protein
MSFAATAVIVIVALISAVRGADSRVRQAGLDTVSDGLLLMACTLALLHAARIELVGHPLAQESLGAEGDSVTLPAVGRPVSVLVGGVLLRGDSSAPTTAHYALAVRDGTRTLVTHEGWFGDTWDRVGLGRAVRWGERTIVEQERIDFSEETTGRGLTLTLSELDGDLDGPVEVGLVPAPWSPLSVSIVGMALLLLSASVDAIRGASSRRTACLAVLGSFTLCLTHLVMPSGSWLVVVEAAVLSCLLGAPLGMMVHGIARRVVVLGSLGSTAP